jgi:hypothetical protein
VQVPSEAQEDAERVDAVEEPIEPSESTEPLEESEQQIIEQQAAGTIETQHCPFCFSAISRSPDLTAKFKEDEQPVSFHILLVDLNKGVEAHCQDCTLIKRGVKLIEPHARESDERAVSLDLTMHLMMTTLRSSKSNSIS